MTKTIDTDYNSERTKYHDYNDIGTIVYDYLDDIEVSDNNLLRSKLL